MQSPNRVADIYSVTEREWEAATLRDGRPDGGFEKVHVGVADAAGVVVGGMWVRRL